MRVCFTSIFALDSERVRRLARTELSTNHSAERSRRDIEMKNLHLALCHDITEEFYQ